MKHGLITKHNMIKKTFLHHCILHLNAKVISVDVVRRFQKLQQVKTVGLHVRSLSQHPPHIPNSRLARRTDFFGPRRKDCLTRSTLSSDTRGRPALFPLQRHPFVWNCWYQYLMLLGDGGSLLNCRRNACWKLMHASQISAHKMLSAPESPLLLCYITDRERRGEWDRACGQNWNTCRFIPCGELTSACVLKAVMADWNCSNHFDRHCTLIRVHIYTLVSAFHSALL